ncbi:MAG: hypothetical protein ACT4P2_12565 [Pseudomonadota bacterium]
MSDGDIERDSLPAHVSLCALRYAALERRLARVEWGLYAVIGLLLLGEGTVVDVIMRLFRH